MGRRNFTSTNCRIITSIAVSYTHLDVYKRQQPDDMIFLFLKAADCIVAVYQHSKGGRLHSADIQCFMVEDREKAGRVNANEMCIRDRGYSSSVKINSLSENSLSVMACSLFTAAAASWRISSSM